MTIRWLVSLIKLGVAKEIGLRPDDRTDEETNKQAVEGQTSTRTERKKVIQTDTQTYRWT